MRAVFLCLFLLLCQAGCRAEPRESPHGVRWQIALIVLGNEPLDDSTPTIDTVARVGKAVEYHQQHPDSVLIFTGGATVGKVSEAQMMANIATAKGVPLRYICLEEKARTTEENARFTANIVRGANVQKIYIVSKKDHLDWAMPIFRKLEEFQSADGLACDVDRNKSIVQMEEYLKSHDSRKVRDRLQKLKNGIQGTD